MTNEFKVLLTSDLISFQNEVKLNILLALNTVQRSDGAMLIIRLFDSRNIHCRFEQLILIKKNSFLQHIDSMGLTFIGTSIFTLYPDKKLWEI